MSICNNCPNIGNCFPGKAEACDAAARALRWSHEKSPAMDNLKDKLMKVATVITTNTPIFDMEKPDKLDYVVLCKIGLITGYYIGKFGFTSVDELKKGFPKIFEG